MRHKSVRRALSASCRKRLATAKVSTTTVNSTSAHLAKFRACSNPKAASLPQQSRPRRGDTGEAG